MEKERRKSNKQVTIESLEKEVHEIKEKVNYDGGLVYRCDLEELKKQDSLSHESIIKKIDEAKLADDKMMGVLREHTKQLEKIYPKVCEDMEVARAYEIIGKTWDKGLRSSGFWIKVVVGISIISVIVFTVAKEVKSFLK